MTTVLLGKKHDPLPVYVSMHYGGSLSSLLPVVVGADLRGRCRQHPHAGVRRDGRYECRTATGFFIQYQCQLRRAYPVRGHTIYHCGNLGRADI